jgi:hypothetical protein
MGEPVIETSDLFPMLLEQVSDADRLTVLDVGSGNSDTVRFFSNYRCRLIFTDLIDVCANGTPDFDEVLNFSDDLRVDICLFWDVLDFMSPETVGMFMRYLAPYLHAGTLGHGYAAYSSTKPITSCDYGVASSKEILVRSMGRVAPYAHGQAAIGRLLGSFDLKRRTLLQGGRLEMLLQAKP